MGRQRAGRRGLDDALISLAHEWARRSCADQGVPVKVTDPGTLGHVARLLGGETVGVRRLPAPSTTRLSRPAA